MECLGSETGDSVRERIRGNSMRVVWKVDRFADVHRCMPISCPQRVLIEGYGQGKRKRGQAGALVKA